MISFMLFYTVAASTASAQDFTFVSCICERILYRTLFHQPDFMRI